MEPSWPQMIRSLGAAAGELADAQSGDERTRLTLRALGAELAALADQPAQPDSPRATARTLLLTAERAAKVSESLADMLRSRDPAARSAAAGVARMAAALAADARQRGLPLLSLLDDAELRANFEREFESHSRSAAELASRS